MKTTAILATFALAAALPALAAAQESALDLSQAYALANDLRGSASETLPAPADVKPIPVTGLTAPLAKAAPKKWTIMVYLDGKNSLEEFVYTNLHQMEAVGSTDKVNVVVEVGRMNGQGGDFTGDGNWTGCRRFLIKKAAKPTDGISSPILQTIPNCDMGDYKHGIEFGKWAMTNFPAEHYMYVLWNHGGGWVATTPGFTNAKSIAYDEETKHVMSTPQMGQIIKALGHIDVYGSDACLMQMAEVAYELRGTTDFVVGSEKTEPGTGWDYTAFLKKVNASGLTAQEVANAVVDTYTPQYTTGATLSTIKSSAMDGLVDKLNSFVGAVVSANEGKIAAAAREKALNFEAQGSFRENKDLYDLVSLIAASSKDVTVKNTAENLMTYITGTLVVDNKVSKDFAKAKGVAIYAPTTGFDNAYNATMFGNTKWPELIKLMQK
jgi:hypothetical protein